MAILDDRAAWHTNFRESWLAHVEATGTADWKRYAYGKNTTDVAGPGTTLASARLLFVTSSGAYLRDAQEPFDAANVHGDTSHRLFHRSTPLERLAFAHEHYDHAYVDQDAQSLVPLRHMDALEDDGVVASWAPTVFSFSGYVPDATRVVDDVVPPLLELAAEEEVDGALLVPV